MEFCALRTAANSIASVTVRTPLRKYLLRKDPSAYLCCGKRRASNKGGVAVVQYESLGLTNDGLSSEMGSSRSACIFFSHAIISALAAT